MRLRRLLAYGLAGWGIEVLFTGVGQGLWTRDRRLVGHSYLWMLPIYGAGGFALEELHARLADRGVPRWARSIAYMAVIYGLEYGSAAVLNRTLGDVPWRYRKGLNLHGYVRLDYAPFWYACGWLFESLQGELRKLDRPARRAHRPRAVSAPAAGAASSPPRGRPFAPSLPAQPR